MNKHTIENVFKANNAKTETAMDKTTRVVREIVDEEAEQRQAKINRLRHTPGQTHEACESLCPV